MLKVEVVTKRIIINENGFSSWIMYNTEGEIDPELFYVCKPKLIGCLQAWEKLHKFYSLSGVTDKIYWHDPVSDVISYFELQPEDFYALTKRFTND